MIIVFPSENSNKLIIFQYFIKKSKAFSNFIYEISGRLLTVTVKLFDELWFEALVRQMSYQRANNSA